jgi:glycosyltransferase involved in cell wall biosynthesis
VIFFDTTKTGAAGHRSGLTRVSARLRAELGGAATPVSWTRGAWRTADGHEARLTACDWLLTGELFSEEERPGFGAWLAARPCRTAAIFHDAIPLKHPHITWPQSVARHPAYLKLLADCDRVWAVSAASRDELLGFWRWQGLERTPPVDVLALGADFDAAPRRSSPDPRPQTPDPQSRSLLCLGIVEPRKNQGFLLGVCDALWRDGLAFTLHVVGRVNPHFGAPIVAQLKALRGRVGARLQFHEAADDATVARLFGTVRATVFPTIAEGCGLPLLESLWRGVPCVCSDLPVLRENADAGGCLPAAPGDAAAWQAALRAVLTDDALHARLAAEACMRPLPTWAEAAAALRHGLQRRGRDDAFPP